MLCLAGRGEFPLEETPAPKLLPLVATGGVTNDTLFALTAATAGDELPLNRAAIAAALVD